MPYAADQMQTRIKKAISDVKKAVYTVIGKLTMTAWVTPEPVPFGDRMSGVKKTLDIGDRWGNLWDCAWFHFTGTIPPGAAGKMVVLLIDLGGEACLTDNQGGPIQGLTNMDSEFDRALGTPGKRVVYLKEKASGDEPIDLWADAATNDLFGKYRDNGTIQAAYIALCDEGLKSFYYNLEFLFELMSALPEQTARHDSILFALYRASQCLNRITPDDARARVRTAQKEIAYELSKKTADPSLVVSALGHSHIDLAWLWPLRETVRKGARTFATALTMMERYPNYVFGASQPQLYDWVKTYYPSLFEKIKPRVAEGRWEPLGAMWVEADTNLPGGESLVRQILYGKRFFQNEYNREPTILWLPDSFGFSAVLPQLLKKSGIAFFLTTKLSWNRYDQYPHHTFVWQGIDGSSVLVHMPPEGTYNSSAAPRAVIAAESDYRDKGVADRCLMVFGIGDGGGGPGEEHLEMLNREKNSAGLSPVRQERAEEFFKELAVRTPWYRYWQGELYLERHQGTYTTQARIKRANRKIELQLRELEFYASIAAALSGANYPAPEIETIWKEVLLYQFHDIMAGSAINRVYRESSARYDHLFDRIGMLRQKALQAFIPLLDTGKARQPGIVWNTTSWDREEWLHINHQWYRAGVPPLGYAVIDLDSPENRVGAVAATASRIENGKLAVELGADGSVSGIFDQENQRSVLAGPGNRLAVYDDDGDAWDFQYDYAECEPEYFRLIQAAPFVDGPLAGVRQIYTYGNSTLEQDIILTAGSRRLDFVTRVDWRERRKMLRTSFPVAVRNTEAACDIQFGSIRRPTRRNTTWEMAKFEVCAHKWIDLSDAASGYGAALLNDCKYGHKVENNILDINLLRSPVYPDPEADQGFHEFTYSLFPHRGNHIDGKVVQAGYELNIPLTVFPAAPNLRGQLPPTGSFFKIEPGNIIIETVKKAEDSLSLILRLYECAGCDTCAKLDIRLPVKRVELVDLMEKDCDQSKLRNASEIFFAAFEIHSLKLEF